MKIKGLLIVTVWAQNVEKTMHVFRDVLGLSMVPHHGPRPHFKIGETPITILQSDAPMTQFGQTQRFPSLAFEVESLDEATQRLNSYGVELPWGVEDDGNGRWVMFRDPAGNLIEIAERLHQGNGTTCLSKIGKPAHIKFSEIPHIQIQYICEINNNKCKYTNISGLETTDDPAQLFL